MVAIWPQTIGGTSVHSERPRAMAASTNSSSTSDAAARNLSIRLGARLILRGRSRAIVAMVVPPGVANSHRRDAGARLSRLGTGWSGCIERSLIRVRGGLYRTRTHLAEAVGPLVWPLRDSRWGGGRDGSPGLIRTGDHSINSRTLYR